MFTCGAHTQIYARLRSTSIRMRVATVTLAIVAAHVYMSDICVIPITDYLLMVAKRVGALERQQLSTATSALQDRWR